jgi:hypothetical protein
MLIQQRYLVVLLVPAVVLGRLLEIVMCHMYIAL